MEKLILLAAWAGGPQIVFENILISAVASLAAAWLIWRFEPEEPFDKEERRKRQEREGGGGVANLLDRQGRVIRQVTYKSTSSIKK